MNSYDYLMGNLQAALRAQRPVMKSRVRKRKIRELYERYKNSTTVYIIKREKLGLYRPYKYHREEK